ncbi:MAG: hydroxymethylglutaryl-CoA reductase, degradative [Candidatus Diapherotrites archaeon]|nr:hydroxymethylglutaryl-CoA reductase, degradative [Candidatus Diapherotrites archaeon]
MPRCQTVNSQVSGFYKLSPKERLDQVAAETGLSDEEKEAIANAMLPMEQANRMIENVIGEMPIPLGIAVNFKINGEDKFIPMAIEEPSVVAACSYAAKLARIRGGFTTEASEPIMIGQIQLLDVPDPEGAIVQILARKKELIEKANSLDPILVKFGGGARDVEARVVDSIVGKMLICHLLVDCRDAMGANAVNTMVEGIAPMLEEITGGEARLRIISNLAVHRTSSARAVWDKEAIGGEEVVDRIIQAYAFAAADQYRCTTHNKGAMNGVTAVVIATGNDFRAVEAGAHSFAARSGKYSPLTHYEKDADGNLVGSIEIPTPVGLVGGATKTHPVARANVKILGVKTAQELGQIIAMVGLAQNFAALRALATEGIQRGHMNLHAKNIAVLAGAKGDMIDKVAQQLVKEKKVRVDRAQEIVKELQ